MTDYTAKDMQIGESGEAVTAILKTKTELDHVVEAFEERGFRKSDVSVVMPVTDGRAELAFAKETKAYKYSVIGGIAGTILGALYGWAGLNGWVSVPGAEFVAQRAPWMVLSVPNLTSQPPQSAVVRCDRREPGGHSGSRVRGRPCPACSAWLRRPGQLVRAARLSDGAGAAAVSRAERAFHAAGRGSDTGRDGPTARQ